MKNEKNNAAKSGNEKKSPQRVIEETRDPNSSRIKDLDSLYLHLLDVNKN